MGCVRKYQSVYLLCHYILLTFSSNISEQDARDTFKYILTEGIGDVQSPHFYKYYAQFELRCNHNNQLSSKDLFYLIGNNVLKAQQILLKGLQKKALTQQMVDEILSKANVTVPVNKETSVSTPSTPATSSVALNRTGSLQTPNQAIPENSNISAASVATIVEKENADPNTAAQKLANRKKFGSKSALTSIIYLHAINRTWTYSKTCQSCRTK